jgi:hypothetical protein
VDGVTVAEGDRVLVKNQTNSADNGIHIASSGTWSRAADWNGSRDVVNGTQVGVTAGTTQAGLFFTTVTVDPAVIGTTAVTFTSSAAPTNSAAAAAASAAAALASQNSATASEAAALASANAADVSEAAALASQNSAAASAGTATTQASNALASANAADVSEAAALASQVAAAASAAAAAAIEIAAPTHAATSKGTPVDADELPLVDSAGAWGLVKLTLANLKAAVLSAPSITGLLTIAGQIKFPATQSASADPNTLDDYEEGSFTVNLTGLTTVPAPTWKYTKVGNVVTLKPSDMVLTGTSNAATKTIVGIPAALFPAAIFGVPIASSDNGAAYTLGWAIIDYSTSTILLYPTPALGTWTASGTMSVRIPTITYTLP